MAPLSRRQFLQFTGVAFLAAQLPPLPIFDSQSPGTLTGRALAAALVRTFPSSAAPATNRLWPDSVIPVLGSRDGWYHLATGWVERSHLQPMKPYQPDPNPPAVGAPFWAEVAGPVAPVRRFCAPNAPQVARIGHGGLARVIDYLPDEPSPWYGITDESGDLLGWSPAVHWRPAASDSPTRADQLEIDLRQSRIIAWGDNRRLMQAPCALGSSLLPGTYRIESRQMAKTYRLTHPLHGVPWVVQFGAGALAGAYWHNDFGKPFTSPGPAVQVPPLAAEWLYSALAEDAHVVVN